MDMLTCQYIKLPEDTSLPNFFNLTSYVTGSLKVNCFHVSVDYYYYYCYVREEADGFTAKSHMGY